MRATIRTIAEEAGVSEATVSYVLNDKGNVSSGVRDRVKAIIKKNGYRPRRKVKQTPVGAKHGKIAVVFPYSPDTSYQERCGELFTNAILSGIEQTCAGMGLSTALCTASQEGRLPATFDKDLLDGVIAFGNSVSTALPSVTVFSPLIPTVSDGVYPDHEACGVVAAERLSLLGCKHCVFLNTQAWHEGFVARKEALTTRLAAKAIEAAAIEGAPDGSEVPAEDLVRRLLLEHPEADGIFIPGSDVHVAAICMELRKQGKPPSSDFHAISCLSNIEMLGPLNLGIDFIDIRLLELGRAAAETLVWRLQHKDAPLRRIMVLPKLLSKDAM